MGYDESLRMLSWTHSLMTFLQVIQDFFIQFFTLFNSSKNSILRFSFKRNPIKKLFNIILRNKSSSINETPLFWNKKSIALVLEIAIPGALKTLDSWNFHRLCQLGPHQHQSWTQWPSVTSLKPVSPILFQKNKG